MSGACEFLYYWVYPNFVLGKMHDPHKGLNFESVSSSGILILSLSIDKKCDCTHSTQLNCD